MKRLKEWWARCSETMFSFKPSHQVPKTKPYGLFVMIGKCERCGNICALNYGDLSWWKIPQQKKARKKWEALCSR